MLDKSRNRLRLLACAGALIAVTAGIVVPISSANAATAGSVILSSWEDYKGRNVFVREGAYDASTAKGFGMKKIRTKHNIKLINSLKFATNNPNGGTAKGQKRQYDAWANKLECVNGKNCEYTDSRPFHVVMDYRKVGVYYGVDLHQTTLGIATAYCTNEDKAHDCPSWVDSAFQNPVDRDSGAVAADSADSSRVPSSDGTDSVTLSYQPLGPVTSPSSGASGLDADD
jgi:hypothetical protein